MAEKIEMGKEKVTWMKLTTKPLDNHKNFTKVKKALCCLPQIRDQVFDEKSKTTVTIKVVCCSPEKVMKKLCEKGDGAIKFIETIDPPKPATQKPKEAEKPKPAPVAPTSQTMTYGYYPPPMVTEPVMNYGPNHGWVHHNGYAERPINVNYGEDAPCSIM